MSTAGTIGEVGGGVAGGALGAAIGTALGGPIGTWIGRAVGSRLGRMAGRAAGEALAQMMEKADEDAKPIPDTKAEPCKDCGEIDCFSPPEGADPDEFKRQLQEQQDAINNMKPDDILNNIQKYASGGRPAGDAAARRLARKEGQQARQGELERQFLRQGLSDADAASKAAAQVASEMAQLNATHTLDLIAGGDGSISGLGDASVNKSIGSQWKNGRAAQLKKHAEEAKKKGKKMNVKLEECPPKGRGGGKKGGAGGTGNPGQGQGNSSAPTS
jgi:hypothetical protein